MKEMKQLLWITGTAAAVTAVLLAASLLLLSSCSQEDSGTAPGNDLLVPLGVSTVCMAAEGANTNTRALPIPVTSGTLRVGVRAQNGYTAQTDVRYTYDSGAWTTTATAPVLGKVPISLYAYHPLEEYLLDGSGSVTLTSQPYDAAKDLGYATSGGRNVCATHPYAGFVLKHAYARIKVDIIFSPLFADATVLDAVSVSAAGMTQDGKLNPESGTITAGTTALPELKWTPAKTLQEIDRKFLGDMLLVPSSAVTDAKLTVTIDDSNWAADISAALTRLDAGKSYRIKVVMGSALIIDKVEVEDWITGTGQSGDTQFE